ncbi:hypothetical protein [Prosthecobacter sp.]|uniref:hypothetical protein n=1 Tax=Prosthecobacter sp. TaxID=1965333 RepID=UPI002ABA8160|nr:hypothetical protein [Prosthecobacter sp.]MDZ4402288.1 hypothetical protein [Prosthecobacter sp.]
MPIISTLESKFGRFAIPGLVQVIAMFQLLVLFMVMVMSPEGATAYLMFLDLNPTRVMQGEVWRLVTHVFIPGNFSLIWALIGTLFMMWIGRGLEAAWGAFRVNLYIFGWMFVVTLGALVFGWPAPGLFLYQTLLFAFATLFPNEEIMIYFILPIKMKWLAFLSAGMTAFLVVRDPSLFLPVLACHLNYLVVFGPGFVSESARQARVSARRGRYESAKLPQGTFFHQCSVCKKTELDDSHLDFRVLDSGDEICSECRAKQAGG